MRSTKPALLSLALLTACGGGEGPALILGPAGATTTDDLALTVVDGDADKYEYTWQVEGEDEPRADLTGTTVPADQTEKDQVWTVTATRGNRSNTASITIGNTPPRADVSVDPANPTAADDVEATGQGVDIDGDPTYVEYEWERQVDGKWLSSGIRSRTLTAESTRRGQLWRVIVTPFDGDDAGLASVLEVPIANAAPTIDTLVLSRRRATTLDTLSVDATAVDADGDTTTLQFQWFRNGDAVPDATTQALSGESFEAGDEVYVKVRATDGQTTGPWRASAVVPIDNSPPTRPAAEITPEAPFSDQDLICNLVETSTDPDGDSVSYRAVWTVEGAPFTEATTTNGIEGDTVPASSTRADEDWTCTMVAFDGNGGEGTGSVTTFVDARSGCADGTTEVEWSTTIEGCAAAAEDSWANLTADVASVCADGWVLADSSIVNTVLNGPGYTEDWNFGFFGDGCDGSNAYATTNNSSWRTSASCVWRRSHHTRLGSEDDFIDGLVCEKTFEE